jgi:hypothetical protein
MGRLFGSLGAFYRHQVWAGCEEACACCRPVSQRTFPFREDLSPIYHMRVELNNNTQFAIHFHGPSESCCPSHTVTCPGTSTAGKDVPAEPEGSVNSQLAVDVPDTSNVRSSLVVICSLLNIHLIGR